MGGYGIVGGNLPIAAGIGLAADYLGTDDVTLCMFGDGASNQGTFGETMNLAALWRLPVVFMVTNNQFGMGTALERHSAVTDLQRKGEGFGVPGMAATGWTWSTPTRSSREALRVAREERRPVLVEAITYRFRGHSMADPEEYRTKEQVAEWRKRDPIATFGARLVSRGRARRGRRERARRARRSRASTRRSRSPTPRRSRRPSRSTTTSTCSATRCAAGTRSTSARRRAPRRGRARHATPTERRPRAAVRRSAAGDERRGRRAGRRGAGLAATHGEDGRLMAVMRYREALNEALREELQRDERVFLMGEDIGVFNGAFKVTAGLLEEFGEQRVRDTPISENTIVGMGVGAAMTGLRPVVELMTINFSLLAMDQIVNHAAHIRYMFGGQVTRAARRAHAAGRRPPARADALALASRRCSCTCPACSSPCRRRRPTRRAC